MMAVVRERIATIAAISVSAASATPTRRSTGVPLSASTLMYRVLGGSRTTPVAGTRDDGARARKNAESPGNSDGSGASPGPTAKSGPGLNPDPTQ
ncbi:hypothetical protein I545_0114 [Mycobacterium kansasii 662]|uniref:Uncharacterized protein n=1 Tax=Mycobacterium kansasii 662 TaxID=1299326 RepID=X7ZNV1_MYCKA|nr:hypothetical protein I545_0114 [Mycobacterium kansasii 662]